MSHQHSIAEGRKRVLLIALIANAGYLLVEVIGGLAFNSLALLADAAHMLSDVAGLAIALVAQRLLERPASDRHTYGLQRAEVLGALSNGIFLLAVAGWIIFEAFGRLGEPQSIDGAGLLVVAVIGLLINLGSAVLLARKAGESLNMRGAFIHMAVDAAGSVAVIIAGLAIIIADATWVDTVASIAVALLVLWSAGSLLRDTVQVLLEGTPRGMNPQDVRKAIEQQPHVESVHHLHLWNLASDTPALSAHIVMKGEPSLHQAQLKADTLKVMLKSRFAVEHATLELECHDCKKGHH